jgi:hypothetical protein
MMWGLPAGVLGGLVPALAPVVHVPTRLGVRWIALVARVGARAPLGVVGAPQAAVLAATTGIGAAVFVLRRHR